jgi:5-methylthioadenosine/S-adenosylhomocysteine deaminase
VDTVLVDGTVVKRGGKLTGDAARARQLVEASRDHLLEEAHKAQTAAA